jgi:hypothetical protein
MGNVFIQHRSIKGLNMAFKRKFILGAQQVDFTF